MNEEWIKRTEVHYGPDEFTITEEKECDVLKQNARLQSINKDLFDALEHIAEYPVFTPGTDQCKQMARDAIDKATP